MSEASDQFVSVTGGCLCGAVRYRADANLDEAYYCHCRMCQKSSGSPVEVGVSVRPGTLVFANEEPRYFDSSPIGKRGFCRHCGSRLVWMSPTKPEWTNLSAGSLDQPERVRPTQHLCVESQLPWFAVADDLPRLKSEDLPGLKEEWASAGLTHDGQPL